MLVLSTRLHDKLTFPDFNTSVEVVALQNGSVRLGIDSPEHIRVLRDGLTDRACEWGSEEPTLNQLNKLMEKRLEITRQGLEELRLHLHNGETTDAEQILEKIDEDLLMLRRRVRREVESLMTVLREDAERSVCGTR